MDIEKQITHIREQLKNPLEKEEREALIAYLEELLSKKKNHPFNIKK